MRKIRIFVCEDCGRWTRRARHSISPKVCIECGADRATNAAREMAQRSGPAWESFLASNGPRGRSRAHHAKG